MKKTSFVSLFSIFVLCTLPQSLNAQITITSSDVLKPVGYTFATESTDYGSYSIDLGSTGGPQTWDFSSYFTPNITNIEVVNSGSTPFAANFPTSNFCLNFIEEGFTEELYQYLRVETNFWGYLGFGVESIDTTYVQQYDPMGQIPLPITMGDSWFMELASVDTILGFITSLVARSHDTVDAYGTMTVTAGSFEVLRVVSYDTTISTVGIPPFVFSDTTATIEYEWLGRDPTLVAVVQSMEDETNPNFTEAADITLAGSSTGIGGGEGDIKIPHAFQLGQNAPNPFNPRTDIAFTVSEELEGSVDLAVFTIRGKRVRTLASGEKSPGEYMVSWDGRNDQGEALPSGVYLYRLISGGESQTRKMILAK